MTLTQENKLKEKVRKELLNQRFGSYDGNNEWLSYGYDTFKDWCAGRLIISIGEGTFNNQVWTIIQLSIAWGEYQKKFYGRMEQLKEECKD